MMEIADSVSIGSASGKIKPKDRVEYAPYQSVGNQFPQISLDQFERSVQLVKPDREITEGRKSCARNPSIQFRFGMAFENLPEFSTLRQNCRNDLLFYCQASKRSIFSFKLDWQGKLKTLKPFIAVSKPS